MCQPLAGCYSVGCREGGRQRSGYTDGGERSGYTDGGKRSLGACLPGKREIGEREKVCE